MAKPLHVIQTPRTEECIENCLDCFHQCNETLAYLMGPGAKLASSKHFKLLMDCADLCRTSSELMSRGSEFHGRVCAVCAATCKACAAECEKYPDDKQLASCAEACRRCEKSCQAMGG